MSEQELERPETWDFEHGEMRSPVPNRRTIVSVAVPSKDFAIISAAARSAGMKLSEFIRSAAIEKAEPYTWRPGKTATGSVTAGRTTFVLHDVTFG